MRYLCGDDGRAPLDLLARVLETLNAAACCIGAAEIGLNACTCWQPVYDQDQTRATPIETLDDITTRTDMCADCAFRPDSPERSGDDRYTHASDDELRELDHFWCHQGMRKPVAWRHPSGITLTADIDGYDPPMQLVDGKMVPFKADGTAADRCAGFDAWKRHADKAGV